jgi:hypothetical protein
MKIHVSGAKRRHCRPLPGPRLHGVRLHKVNPLWNSSKDGKSPKKKNTFQIGSPKELEIDTFSKEYGL